MSGTLGPSCNSVSAKFLRYWTPRCYRVVPGTILGACFFTLQYFHLQADGQLDEEELLSHLWSVGYQATKVILQSPYYGYRHPEAATHDRPPYALSRLTLCSVVAARSP